MCRQRLLYHTIVWSYWIGFTETFGLNVTGCAHTER